MKTYVFLLLHVVAICCGCLTSCSDDSGQNKKLLKTIHYTESEKFIRLEYDEHNRLVQFIEGADGETVTTLTYGKGEVLMEKFGAYYGKFILNEQGYVRKFERENTRDCLYEYSDDGFLVKSDNGRSVRTYSYSGENLMSYESPLNNGTFTPSKEKDKLEVPALYQPLSWFILGNSETAVGYLAGLYGRSCQNLAGQLDYTIQEGKEWEQNNVVSYVYKFDKEGYVIQMQERMARGSGYLVAAPVYFTYEDAR